MTRSCCAGLALTRQTSATGGGRFQTSAAVDHDQAFSGAMCVRFWREADFHADRLWPKRPFIIGTGLQSLQNAIGEVSRQRRVEARSGFELDLARQYIEQSGARTKQHRNDVEFDLIDEPGYQ